MMEIWWPYGNKAAPHVHAIEDEWFYISGGELSLSIPGKLDRRVRHVVGGEVRDRVLPVRCLFREAGLVKASDAIRAV
jgi:hypothetical protein